MPDGSCDVVVEVPTELGWLVVRRGLTLVTLGLALGVGAALATTGTMRALLYEVTPVDPVTFAVVAVLLLLTAITATWIPAVRASRADPAATLREE